MERIYHRSDFDCVLRLKDREGNTVPFPDCDFEARFFTASSARPYVARRRGDEYTNCCPEDGGMRFVFNGHNLGIGKLKWELRFRLPNSIYPDGLQDVLYEEQLDIELVEEAADRKFGETEIEAAIPAVYLTAYDLAVRNGYTGSLGEYVSYVNRLPSVVETSDAVIRMLSDFSEGKARIAEALTAQGVPTGADEPLSDMADKVLGLRLAVEGQPGITDQTMDGVLPTYDLLNELRNHLRADYPYCCGVMFPRTEPTVELKMADAYLCSDGFFTEEQDVTHELADTDRDMSYVIYYFRERRYTVPTYINPILRAYALNGHPCWALNKLIPDIRSYSEEPDRYESADIVVANNSFQHLTLAGVRVLNLSVTFAQSCSNLVSLCLPDLEELLSSNQSRLVDNGYVYALHLPKLRMMDGPAMLVNFVSVLKQVNLPRLEKLAGGGYLFSQTSRLSSVSLPMLAEVSGHVASSCAALTELNFPALETITGGTLASNCAALTELTLPALETITGGTLASNCAALTELNFPALVEVANSCLYSSWQTREHTLIRLPNLKRMTASNNYNGLSSGVKAVLEFDMPNLEYLGGSFGRSWPEYQLLIIRLGNKQGCEYTLYADVGKIHAEITVRPGFRSSIKTFYNSIILTPENMRGIIANLGDNTGYPTLALTLGADNLAKLSQEDIAAATSKNYTLS